MSQIILDISANTHKNDWAYLKRMLDELKAVDAGKHEVVIKHQLFMQAGENIPLDWHIFYKAYRYAEKLGYKTTSSVFDKKSLNFLLQYDIPFVKIANNRELDWLIGYVPRKIPVYVSVSDSYYTDNPYDDGFDKLFVHLACVSKYPANINEYESNFNSPHLKMNVSDHTTNWDLFNKYQPKIIEVHYKLENSTGLDAGSFARTPSQLSEVL
jgi:sialic acid synthase SpsE